MGLSNAISVRGREATLRYGKLREATAKAVRLSSSVIGAHAG